MANSTITLSVSQAYFTAAVVGTGPNYAASSGAYRSASWLNGASGETTYYVQYNNGTKVINFNFGFDYHDTYATPSAALPLNTQIRGLQLTGAMQYQQGSTNPVISSFPYTGQWYLYRGASLNGPLTFSDSGSVLASNPPGGAQQGGFMGSYWDLSSYGITGADIINTPAASSGNYQTNGYLLVSSPIVYVLNSQLTAAGSPETDFYSQWYITISHNQAPSPGQLTIGGQSGTVTGASVAPTVTWAYSDPENDAQNAYRVLVFSGYNQTLASAIPIYDSGVLYGVTNTFTIPSGVMSKFTQYSIQVLVSDANSGGRFSTTNGIIGGATTGTAYGVINYEPVVDPLIQPIFTPGFTLGQGGTRATQPSAVYTPSTALVQNMVVSARPNQLTLAEANCDGSAAISSGAGVAGWVASQGTLAVAGSNQYHGVGAIQLTNSAVTTATTISQRTLYANVQQQHVVTFLAHWYSTSTTAFQVNMSIQFDDFTKAPIATVSRTNYVNTNYTLCWVQAIVPQGATLAALTMQIPTTVSSGVYVFDCVSFTQDSVNLITDSGFESAALNSSLYWNFSGTVGSYSSITFTNDPATCDADETNTIGSTSWTFYANGTTYNGYGVQSVNGTTTPLNLSLQGSKVFVSAAMKSTQGASVPLLQIVNGTSLASSPATSTWARQGFMYDGTATATTTQLYLGFGQTPSATPGETRFDDMAITPVYPFVNADFETGSTFNASVPLDTNGWFNNTYYYGYGTVAYSTTHVRTGTQAAMVTQQHDTTTPNGGVLAQLVTYNTTGPVTGSGYYYIAATGTTAVLSLTALNEAGVILKTVTTSGSTIGSFQQASATFTPPTGTAFILFQLSLTGAVGAQVWWDSTSLTNTVNASLPYSEGGWSAGASGMTSTLLLQRSLDKVTWTTVRQPGAYISPPPALNLASPSITYSDIEYPPLVAGSIDSSTSHVYYRALYQASNSVGSNTSIPSATRNFYRPGDSNWTLTDPLNASSGLILNVKSWSAKINEDVATLKGLGRARVVIIGDTVLGDTLTLELFSFTPTDDASLMASVRSQNVLVLRNPYGELWYVRMVGRARKRTWTGSYAAKLNTHTLQLEEVDAVQ